MATLPNTYDFVVDCEGNQLVRSFTSRKAAAPPQFVFGDEGVPVRVRLVRPSTGSDPDLPWTELSLTNLSTTISIGNPAGNPTAGTWELSYGAAGNTTINLAYNASASNVQTELNKLTSIQAAGNVTVVNPATGLYRVTFNNKGSRTMLGADVTALYPTCTKSITNSVAGSATQRAVQLVDVETKRAVALNMTTALPAAAITVTEVRAGSVATGTSEIQTIDLSNPEPYAGTWTATTNQGGASAVTNTSAPLAYNISASALQSALRNTNTTVFANKITVTGAFPKYTVEFDSTLGDVGPITTATGQLDVPKGFQGTLSTNVATFKELLVGKASQTAKMEVRINNTTATTSWTPVVTPCLLLDEVLFAATSATE